jgi:hypothetical protein
MKAIPLLLLILVPFTAKGGRDAPSPLDDVFGSLYAKVFEYALRNHHPGGKFSLQICDWKDHHPALPERFLNKVLASSNDLPSKYVPPERLSRTSEKRNGGASLDPMTDTLDGQEVFLYYVQCASWYSPSLVRVEYKRWRSAADNMWQVVRFRLEGADWVLANDGPRIGDNYDSKGTVNLLRSEVLTAPEPRSPTPAQAQLPSATKPN